MYRIFLLEDDEELRAAYVKALREAGFFVSSSHVAEKLEYEMAQAPYDAYVLDHQLKRGRGTDLIELIRNKGIDAPVFIISSYPLRDFQPLLDKFKNVDYLPKQITAEIMLTRLREKIAEYRAQ